MPRVIIIGASRGIGLELARQYAGAGWEVLATVRRDADLPEIAGVTGAVADMLDEDSLAKVAAQAGSGWDVLIVNAGVNVVDTNLASLVADDWTRVMTTNALGPMLVARQLGGAVKDGGTIAALSSTMGSITQGGGGYYAYRMSKAALNMGLMNLSQELRPRRIKVVALHPGWVKTDMGGASAAVEIPDSVSGLRRVIDTLPGGKAAQYLDYQGAVLPW
ncbi:SDR family oxidoreductase [Glacieibacterium sp.]|uniref:SDR family oxidoreductase n=1 Tax=Glacieibacterium sp. TaxID=2860237 RepID=UPI003B00D30B